MPRVFALLLMILLLLVASCAEPEVVAELPTAVAELPTTAVTLATPTSTSTAVPTATDIPTATPTAKATATLPPTAIPATPTATVIDDLPIPSGTIYFLWDPRQHNTTNRELYLSFYRAQFTNPQEWTTEAILQNLVAPNFVISPNRTKFVFSVYEDTNQSGSIEYYSASELDSQNLYLYDLIQSNYNQLNIEPSYFFDLAWLDNNTVTYRDLVALSIHESLINSIKINDEIGIVTWLQPSPSGQYLVLHHKNPEPTLIVVETSTGEILLEVPNWEVYSWVSLKIWTEDETRFVIKGAMPVPLLINLAEKTYQALELDGSIIQWINSETILYYSSHTISSLSVTIGEMTDIFATSKIISSTPAMMPDQTSLIFSLYADGLVDVVYYDIQKNELTTIWQYNPNDYGFRSGEFSHGIDFYTWSPDKQWGIFGLSVYDDTWTFVYGSELFLFHVETKQVVSILQSPLSFPPEFVEWIE